MKKSLEAFEAKNLEYENIYNEEDDLNPFSLKSR